MSDDNRKYVEQRWAGSPRGGPMRFLRRLLGIALVVVVLALAVPMLAHLAKGASGGEAVSAALDDYRALMGCPGEVSSVGDLLGRDDFTLESDVLQAEFCSGALAERNAAATATPAPGATLPPTATP